jgi:phosphate starvation-inducible protein PhoH
MNKITNFDREEVVALRGALQNDLDQLAAKYGIKITVGNATFARDGASVDYKVSCVVEGGKTLSQQRRDEKKSNAEDSLKAFGSLYAPGIDLEAPFEHPQILGKIKLTGYNTRAPKMPFQGVVVEGAEKGRTLKFGTDLVKKYGVKIAK